MFSEDTVALEARTVGLGAAALLDGSSGARCASLAAAGVISSVNGISKLGASLTQSDAGAESEASMHLCHLIRGVAWKVPEWSGVKRGGGLGRVQRQLAARLSVQQTVETTETPSSEEIYQQVTKRTGRFSSAPIISQLPSLVVVISGPSGVGKDSVIQELQKQRQQHLHFVVTATTRAKRVTEIDGVDYDFVSKEVFERWIRDGQMFEYATVYDEYKGVPKPQMEEAFRKGKDCILRLDVQGAARVRTLLPDCVTIYLSPQSEEELVKRLISRKTESLEDMIVRVQKAKQELHRSSEFDYIVLNKEGEMQRAVDRICSILDAEKSKRTRLNVKPREG